MAGPDFLGKGIKFPPRLVTTAEGLTIWAAAEGEESIRDSIILILSTAKGERIMRPDFGCGIHKFLFSENNVTTHTLVKCEVEEALKKYEPRIILDVVKVEADGDKPYLLNIDITYRVASNNKRENLVFPFYLERE